MSELLPIREQLRRIERAIRDIDKRLELQAILPCCATDPSGVPVPSLIPRVPASPLPTGTDQYCIRVQAALRQVVRRWNQIWDDPEPLLIAPSTTIEWVVAGLASNVWSYTTLMKAQELGQWIGDRVQETFIVPEPIDYCVAARQYLETDGIPQVILDNLDTPGRAGFTVFWTLVGGISWVRDVPLSSLDTENLNPDCCLPSPVSLVPSVQQFFCGNDAYSIDMLTTAIPELATPLIFVPGADGIVYIRRAPLAGRYFRQVGAPGRFNLWVYYADQTNSSGCAFLNAPNSGNGLELSNGLWYYVSAFGSPYFVIRNRASFEGVSLEVFTLPTDQNPIENI